MLSRETDLGTYLHPAGEPLILLVPWHAHHRQEHCVPFDCSPLEPLEPLLCFAEGEENFSELGRPNVILETTSLDLVKDFLRSTFVSY